MDGSYYNTTHQRGETLDLFRRQASNQETDVAAFFIRHSHRDFTPSEVWAQLFDGRVPLTSVRRAVTNLTTRGVLYRTERQRPGPYGRPEYCWKMKSEL